MKIKTLYVSSIHFRNQTWAIFFFADPESANRRNNSIQEGQARPVQIVLVANIGWGNQLLWILIFQKWDEEDSGHSANIHGIWVDESSNLVEEREKLSYAVRQYVISVMSYMNDYRRIQRLVNSNKSNYDSFMKAMHQYHIKEFENECSTEHERELRYTALGFLGNRLLPNNFSHLYLYFESTR